VIRICGITDALVCWLSQAGFSRQEVAAGLIQPYAGEFPDAETARVFV
jgi:hypothetical protein